MAAVATRTRSRRSSLAPPAAAANRSNSVDIVDLTNELDSVDSSGDNDDTDSMVALAGRNRPPGLAAEIGAASTMAANRRRPSPASASRSNFSDIAAAATAGAARANHPPAPAANRSNSVDSTGSSGSSDADAVANEDNNAVTIDQPRGMNALFNDAGGSGGSGFAALVSGNNAAANEGNNNNINNNAVIARPRVMGSDSDEDDEDDDANKQTSPFLFEMPDGRRLPLFPDSAPTPTALIMKLQYKVGDRVECVEGNGWVSGTVSLLSPSYTSGGFLPYQISLDRPPTSGSMVKSFPRDKIRRATTLRFLCGDLVECKVQSNPNVWASGRVETLWFRKEESGETKTYPYVVRAVLDGRILRVYTPSDSPAILRSQRPLTNIYKVALRFKVNQVVEYQTEPLSGSRWVKGVITKLWSYRHQSQGYRHGRGRGFWLPYQLVILDSGEVQYAYADNDSVVRSIPTTGLDAFHHQTRDLSAFVNKSNWSLDDLKSIKAWHRSMLVDIEVRETAVMKKLAQKEEGRRCVICRDKPKSVVLMPCRHQCVCTDCLMRCNDCPLCRSKINNPIIAFM